MLVEALTLGLLLLAAVLASSLIDQIIPRVSLPLIQIAIGLLIAVVAGGDVEVTLDPELFLVMFIAPLLYDEAKHADKQALWRERKPVLSLAIGLVVATTLVIGFLLNAFVPSIPLAAAFALGAALGPTDAVAVSSLSKQVDIPKRQASMLKGELLLNDASGIVSFQFAIAAVVTGAFSLIDASVDFLVEFVGGLILGVLLGLLGNWVVKRARSIGVENTNFHVLFEVLIPFLIYLVANVCHVSGVIAVVVAGLINVTSPKGVIGPSVSRMNIVSGSVWHVLTYALNGIVFVLLGTQLPLAMQDTWENVRITNSTLILLVFALTFVLLATRFLWVLAMDLYHVRRDEKRRFGKGDLRSALITTFCGAKGTITLSIMFSIPTYAVYGPPNVPFPQRELLIFLACGVIVCTLLLATFVVPLLAPARDKGEEELRRIDQDAATTMDIMREVIEMLTAHKVYTETELRSRYEIMLENYCKTVCIEAQTMSDMARKQILPAVARYAADVARDAAGKKALDAGISCGYETKLVKNLAAVTERIDTRVDALDSVTARLKTLSDVTEEADFIRDELLSRMTELRAAADEAEILTAESCWPFPTYGDLLFSVK